MMATSEDNAGNLVYSVSMYRSRRSADISSFLYLALKTVKIPYFGIHEYASHGLALSLKFHVKSDFYRYLHEPNSAKKKIVRNREFDDSIREEDIEMPTQLPPEVERKSIQERIQVQYLIKTLQKHPCLCYLHVCIKVGLQH